MFSLAARPLSSHQWCYVISRGVARKTSVNLVGVSWKEMTQPEYLGGLGPRDIELFNLAMLARQARRILKEPESLSARELRSTYFPDGNFLNAQLGARPSNIWRAIIEGRTYPSRG